MRISDCRISFRIVLVTIFLWIGTASAQCSSSSPRVGFQADFVMVQHQLRGSFRIVNDCSFVVSRFDMLPGIDVKWWSAVNDDVYSFLSGKTISDAKLAGLYSNATMEVTLLKGLAWEDIKVLSVWDSATASNFGHIILQLNQSAPPPTSGGPVVEAPNFPPTLGPSPLLAPPPLDDGSSSPPTSSMMGNWEPTMFENCVALSPSFRVRWTLGVVPGTVDIGLESALTKTQYMAFGWAKPGITEQYMIGADVVVAGIDDKGFPLSEDYFMSSYSECNWDKSKPAGVCPDSFFAGTTSGLNNSEMLHGQQIDGITLVRYRRPLASLDINYDVSLNASQEMVAVWAMGSLAPDSMRVHFTPQNHGLPQGVKYGYLNLTLGSSLDQCFGPLPASNASQGNIVVADRGTSLVVTSDVAYEYPNPPNPRKVLYINSKEAPILRVERGVPVTFLVQAGHDVSFYVTSNPIGGSGRSSSKIYAGGPDAHGVPTIPYTLKWLPDRRTPDKVYYQSYFQKKMGWMVQVVDGGLSDMYNTSHLLADGQVTLFWTLTSTDVYFAVRGERKSGYLAVAFGSGMLNSFAYVAWIDDKGNGHIGTYWITDKDASGIHPTAEELFNKKCERVDGVITFEFSRPLKPDCQSGQECKNVIDATSALKMVWAMGDEWSVNLTNGNIHTIVSTTFARNLCVSSSIADVGLTATMASIVGTSLSMSAPSQLSLGSSMAGTKLAHANAPMSPSSAAGPLRVEAMKKIQGRVICASNDKTIAVEVTRIAPHSKYLKRIKSAKKYHAHDPENECNVGDIVTLEKCKPISKSKTFIVVERKVGRPRGERLAAPTLPPLESEAESPVAA